MRNTDTLASKHRMTNTDSLAFMLASWRRILQCGLKNVSTQDETPKTLKDNNPLPWPNRKTTKNLESHFQVWFFNKNGI
jgi:hypothetical protein